MGGVGAGVVDVDDSVLAGVSSTTTWLDAGIGSSMARWDADAMRCGSVGQRVVDRGWDAPKVYG